MLASIDDRLGPAEQRFFGRGFRRVRYEPGRLHVSRGNDGAVQASSSVGVHYPADWSRKAGTDLRPHFSTIDGLVVAAQLAEVCLAGPAAAEGAGHQDAWLRAVKLSAGTSPQEDLHRIPVRATLRGTAPAEGNPARRRSTIDCTAGTMRVRCEVDHAPVRPVVGEAVYDDFSALLGPGAQRYFGEGFTRRRQSVREVEVDHEGLRATAELDVVTEGPAPTPDRGLEGSYRPGVSMVDAFVTALQLAQVMLYDVDGIRRRDSNTLWMRQTTMTAARPDRAGHGIPVAASLENLGLLRMGGGTWRTLDVVAELAGIQVRSAVTHQLPTQDVAS
ncbi:AvrD family protein [Streptomyces sp. NPDC048420]|uniref:AvrD family protein n=1 Tax=Streptomyces sp. NPDC048420 TaxID=3155755 RepID=UPI003448641B